MRDKKGRTPMPEGRVLSHDELLLWLHDQVGRAVSIRVTIKFADGRLEPILVAPGTLRHHSSITPPYGELGGRRGPEIAGVYFLDTASQTPADSPISFNVSDLAHARTFTIDNGVAVVIGDGVWLSIVHAESAGKGDRSGEGV